MKPASAHRISISSGLVVENGLVTFRSDDREFGAFSKLLFQSLNIVYPKFYKMDHLCKLGFLAAEILLKGQNFNPARTAICLGTKHGSLQSDVLHQESISDRTKYFPSPSVFVYTLPNIMLGEICIRQGITGENSCFLMPNFDALFFGKKVDLLFRSGQCDHVIAGWADVNGEQYVCELVRVDANDRIPLPEVFSTFAAIQKSID